MVATAIIGSAVIGGAATAFGASQAAKAQTSATSQANATELAMFNKTQANLQPYADAGRAGVNSLTAAIPGLAAPIQMDQAALEATPGYKFNLAQGLKSVYNGASARGLGASGAALKGGAAFATGLADSTYQNQFNNALANKAMTLKSLMAPVELGENAAAGLGNIGQGTASSIGQNTVGAGNAQAAASIAKGNVGVDISNSLVTAAMGKKLGLF